MSESFKQAILGHDAESFFYEYAGYSWDKMKETEEEGRRRGAKALAAAEKAAMKFDASYHWQHDDITSEEFSDEKPYYRLWSCSLMDTDGNYLGGLGGIDFSRQGNPRDPYRRVVEAELSLEYGFTQEITAAKMEEGKEEVLAAAEKLIGQHRLNQAISSDWTALELAVRKARGNGS